jgi:alpha-1,3/alpha-1,6-mannosyltransferase
LKKKSIMSVEKQTIYLVHPDLGIGGAERLLIDVALALQSDYQVLLFSSSSSS